MRREEANEIAADLTGVSLRESMADAQAHVERYTSACIEILPYCELTYVEGSNEGKGLVHLLGSDCLFTVKLSIAPPEAELHSEPKLNLSTEAKLLESETWDVELKSRYVALAENGAPGLETSWTFSRSGEALLLLTGTFSPGTGWISASEGFARAMAERVGYMLEQPEFV